MKKYMLLAAAAVLAIACDKPEETAATSLEVNPASLEFAASGAASQTLEVTATNVRWKQTVSADAQEWLNVTQDGNTLTVTVTDNLRAEERTGQIRITATDNKKIPQRSVSVVQKGNKNPVETSIDLNPSSLTFGAEGAKPQDVTVTVSDESLTWSVAPDAAAEGWVTAVSGEGKITVSVADNPYTERRSGLLTVTPSDKSAGSKAIRILQEAKVLPPSLKVDRTDPIEWNYNDTQGVLVNITAVNVKWTVEAVNDEGARINWVTPTPTETYINIVPLRNRDNVARSGFIVIKADVPDIEDIRIAVSQTAAPEYLTTLTDDLDVSALNLDGAYSVLAPYAVDDTLQPTILWDVNIMSEGVNLNPNTFKYEGTGSRFHMEIVTDRIEVNDESVYVIPDGIYKVIEPKPLPDDPLEDYFKDAWTINRGEEGTSFWSKYKGFWYTELENGEIVGSAPVISGTVTISKQAAGVNTYKIEFDLVDDYGYKITGAYTGSIGLHVFGETLPD